MNIAYVKHSQVICGDHFHSHHVSNTGRLLSAALPRPTGNGNVPIAT